MLTNFIQPNVSQNIISTGKKRKIIIFIFYFYINQNTEYILHLKYISVQISNISAIPQTILACGFCTEHFPTLEIWKRCCCNTENVTLQSDLLSYSALVTYYRSLSNLLSLSRLQILPVYEIFEKTRVEILYNL